MSHYPWLTMLDTVAQMDWSSRPHVSILTHRRCIDGVNSHSLCKHTIYSSSSPSSSSNSTLKNLNSYTPFCVEITRNQSRNYHQPPPLKLGTYILFLEELLCEILQVSSAELGAIGNNDNFTLFAGDGDTIAEVSCAIVYLDSVVEEFLKGGGVEDFIVCRCRRIEDVLPQLACCRNKD